MDYAYGFILGALIAGVVPAITWWLHGKWYNRRTAAITIYTRRSKPCGVRISHLGAMDNAAKSVLADNLEVIMADCWAGGPWVIDAPIVARTVLPVVNGGE